ncbi:aminomethyl-transferring glycine dehydrogenase [Alkalitalea saponilacus]|uniref:Glycine dehydrogenase (decarboxylating) n=1 Tax=Alkalitalea saponilacus TaxID=889453 RepID=A0A1T5BDR6_9BACT|nr:aminomethyl-transferring glycine dehydrogenase [Alkalitalea saponilacus]ASB49711.1 glycine dehydrogenase (aminomethyl-transferring) [Alkalitalea saponilacus]SKB45424.1 glycine dehydrogenase [Alkalitalea saponilacus]
MSFSPFVARHIGPQKQDVDTMLLELGVESLDELLCLSVPDSIRTKEGFEIGSGISESDFLEKIRKIASKNRLLKTYIGMGYYNTFTPSVIIRNVLENPVWYTSYTPYQAEISQGRLEALLNFQTMVSELTSMEIANASLLDEATAVAEAMIMMYNTRSRKQIKSGVNVCIVDDAIWPQTRSVIETRALGLGIELEFVGFNEIKYSGNKHFGAIFQYPNAMGEINDYEPLVSRIHEQEGKVVVASDLLSLTLLKPPGEWGADIVVGSTQRMGVPMAYGGPHAGYFATREEFKRFVPGRIIGVTRDVKGKRALRMALQTREQHIKREKATSNICTAQALLASMAGFYAVYHGPDGLRSMALRIHKLATSLVLTLKKLGVNQLNNSWFDTLRFRLPDGVTCEKLRAVALQNGVNFLYRGVRDFGVSLDETSTVEDIKNIAEIVSMSIGVKTAEVESSEKEIIPESLKRLSQFMKQEVFHKYRSETDMMRYIKLLERKDISLAHSMISLGSCTMKLNAASEMFPITWPEFGGLHPFVPKEQAAGYHEMMNELRSDLAKITGFADVSLQPNSGASGEYAGLMVIRAYHESKGEGHRDVALIPSSAHGTNPASAVMAGLKVIVVKCDENGNIDVADLKEKAKEHRENLSCLMVTYPSTHGVFEASIKDVCKIIHDNGGQVYMDGANMNAQVGITNPGIIGADVCHLNLHKTFAIPHGGGGPGVGPIGVAKHLIEFLPGHPVIDNKRHGVMTISAAPWGSAGVLPITYGYIKMMGAEGLTYATKIAILNANYIAKKLEKDYNILYTGEKGYVAHELILECRNFKNSSGVTETDIAKRLIDYGFHAPTLSFPVAGTLMVEPTESESLAELDRFIEAMKAIRDEIREVENGETDKEDNLLKNSPHADYELTSDDWTHPYSRERAGFPLTWVRERKFWISVGRVDNAWGDRNLICTCDPVDSYQ